MLRVLRTLVARSARRHVGRLVDQHRRLAGHLDELGAGFTGDATAWRCGATTGLLHVGLVDLRDDVDAEAAPVVFALMKASVAACLRLGGVGVGRDRQRAVGRRFIDQPLGLGHVAAGDGRVDLGHLVRRDVVQRGDVLLDGRLGRATSGGRCLDQRLVLRIELARCCDHTTGRLRQRDVQILVRLGRADRRIAHVVGAGLGVLVLGALKSSSPLL